MACMCNPVLVACVLDMAAWVNGGRMYKCNLASLENMAANI